MSTGLVQTAAYLLAGVASPATVEVDVERVRSARGLIHACLSRDPLHFPDCRSDPAALTLSVPASQARLRFSGLAPGRYALTLFHDENGNRKLDTLLGIPREGFGFSRNPAVRFGAPRFNQVAIVLDGGINRQTLRMQYLL